MPGSRPVTFPSATVKQDLSALLYRPPGDDPNPNQQGAVVMYSLTVPRLFRRPLEKFPRVAERMCAMVDRFLEALHSMDACFIAGDTLEWLPEPGWSGRQSWEASTVTSFEYGP